MVDSNEYTKSDGTCPFCGGSLWQNNTHSICEECDTSFGSGETLERTTADDPWSNFQQNRPTYNNSGIPRCVGGFGDAYDWTRSEDIDGPVSSVNADEFYT